MKGVKAGGRSYKYSLREVSRQDECYAVQKSSPIQQSEKETRKICPKSKSSGIHCVVVSTTRNKRIGEEGEGRKAGGNRVYLKRAQ